MYRVDSITVGKTGGGGCIVLTLSLLVTLEEEDVSC